MARMLSSFLFFFFSFLLLEAEVGNEMYGVEEGALSTDWRRCTDWEKVPEVEWKMRFPKYHDV